MDQVNPILFGALTFFLGLFVGNRLALDRERRKERNDAAQAVRLALLKHRSDPSPTDVWPTIVDFDLLERLLPWWRRKGFRNAIERYRQSKKRAENRDNYGGTFYSDTTAIKADLERLIAYTNWH